MEYLILYYFIGVLVSIYFIYYYRLSNKTKSEPKKTDALGALIGPWVWPAQIYVHLVKVVKNDNKNNTPELMEKFRTFLLAFSLGCWCLFLLFSCFNPTPEYWFTVTLGYFFYITMFYIFRVRFTKWILK